MRLKQILKLPPVRGAVSFFISLLLRAIYLTSRVTRTTPAATADYMSGNKQAIFCFWHGNMIMHPFHKPRGRKMAALISHHRDGALITSILGWLGIGTVRGSTRKGGASAMRELLAVCESGTNISITPDGPRGPLHNVAGGAAKLARHSHLPLIPVAFYASRGRTFSSWDRFFLPYPFTRIAYVLGDPVHVTDSEDEASSRLKKSLLACLDAAAAEVGQTL
jgi:lysophospholipid acyltransferase (LPLAT)-like uncharacterized protein